MIGRRRVHRRTGARIVAVSATAMLCLGVLTGPAESAEPATEGGSSAASQQDTEQTRAPICQLIRARMLLPCPGAGAVGLRVGAVKTYIPKPARYGSVSRQYTKTTRNVLRVKRVIGVSNKVGVLIPCKGKPKKCKKKKRKKRYAVYQVWAKHYQSGTKHAYKFDIVKNAKFGKGFIRKQERNCRKAYNPHYACHARPLRRRVKGWFPARIVQTTYITNYKQRKNSCPRRNDHLCSD